MPKELKDILGLLPNLTPALLLAMVLPFLFRAQIMELLREEGLGVVGLMKIFIMCLALTVACDATYMGFRGIMAADYVPIILISVVTFMLFLGFLAIEKYDATKGK
jgi:hypothetical protein